MLNHAHPHKGFSLIELMITIAIMMVILTLAVPSFTRWIQNTKVRTVAETLQNGIRLAQVEAGRRSRQITFSLTNQTPGVGAVPVANGSNWSIQTVPLLANDVATFIRGANLSDASSNVIVDSHGVTSITFNSIGRVTNAVGNLTTFDIRSTSAVSDRPLRVTVSTSGQVRMCDPALVLSATEPTGC